MALIGVLSIFYFAYFRRKSESFSDTWIFIRVCLFALVIILCLLIFAFSVIKIFVTIGNETGTESWIFTIINALLLGMYLNICGILTSKKYNPTRVLFFFVLIFLAVSGFGYLGLLIEFGSPVDTILFYYKYQGNSAHGIFFFSYNIILFTLIYFISFITEGDIKER